MALPKMLRSVPTGKPVSNGTKVVYKDTKWVVKTSDQTAKTISIERDGETELVSAADINCYWLKH